MDWDDQAFKSGTRERGAVICKQDMQVPIQRMDLSKREKNSTTNSMRGSFVARRAKGVGDVGQNNCKEETTLMAEEKGAQLTRVMREPNSSRRRWPVAGHLTCLAGYEQS